MTKRAPATINTVLAALGDFYIRTGLGAPDVRRLDLPQRAPRALTARDVTRWLRTVERWLNPRDRALALIPFHAGLRIGEAVALDVDDIQLSARKGLIIVRSGKGKGYREIPVHAELRAKPRALDQRRTPHWAGADTSPALLLNNHGDRLGTRGARDVLVAIADEAGVNDEFSSHVLRHTFGTTLVRDGHDLALVAELMGHARVETTRAYSLPTAEDRQRAINSLPTNRLPSLEPKVNHQFHQLRTGHQPQPCPQTRQRRLYAQKHNPLAPDPVPMFVTGRLGPARGPAQARALVGRTVRAERAGQRAALRLDRLEEGIMSEARWADELHPDSEDTPAEPARLFYANVDEFVRLYLLPNWRRNTLHASWCAKWWEHAEAITRLEALWESWEKQRLEPGTGMATWWRDFADHHMAIHGVAQHRNAGPSFKCDVTKGRHEVPALWATELPPEGMFRDGNEDEP